MKGLKTSLLLPVMVGLGWNVHGTSLSEYSPRFMVSRIHLSKY